MREPINHERCSELLAPFVHGELDPELASQVEAHLDTCSDCSQERAGLEALVAGDVPALTELERARLRRMVLSEAVPMPEEGARYVSAPAATGGARWFRLLGAAAALAVIGGFAYLGLGEGIRGGDAGSTDDSFAGAEGGGGGAEEALEDGGGSLKQRGNASDAAGTTAEVAPMEAQAPAAPSPTFEPELGLVDEKRLNKLGRSGLPLVMFSRAYRADDVAEHQEAFIEEVAAQAPRARGADIRACAGTISAQFPRSLIAYAALAEFEDRGDILVLAFAWTDEESGPLAQSMVWAWSIGDCDGIPAHYSTNVIRPRR